MSNESKVSKVIPIVAVIVLMAAMLGFTAFVFFQSNGTANQMKNEEVMFAAVTKSPIVKNMSCYDLYYYYRVADNYSTTYSQYNNPVFNQYAQFYLQQYIAQCAGIDNQTIMHN